MWPFKKNRIAELEYRIEYLEATVDDLSKQLLDFRIRVKQESGKQEKILKGCELLLRQLFILIFRILEIGYTEEEIEKIIDEAKKQAISYSLNDGFFNTVKNLKL